MAINVQCPTCGTRLKVADESAGKTGKCPECTNPVQIPEAVYEAEDVAEEIAGARPPSRPPAPSPSASPAGSPPEQRRPCPACGEKVVATAAKCRFCGEILDESIRSTNIAQGRSVDPKVIKKFRKEIHGLGGLWIFIGSMALLAGIFLMGQGARLPNAEGLAVFIVVISLVWIALGVFTCLKHMWAVYVGVVLSYISVLGNIVQLVNGTGNILAILLLAAGIVQGHRSITTAKKLNRAGIPLTTKP